MNIAYNMNMKCCATCDSEREESDFYKNNKSPDGLSYKCKYCLKDYMLTWRPKNKHKIINQRDNWREQNREKYLEYMRNWHIKNRIKVSKRNRLWRSKNPNWHSIWKKVNADKVRHYSKVRRLRIRKVEPCFYTTKEIYDRDKGICGLCKEFIEFSVKQPRALSPSIDHIIPIARGGTDTFDNIQIAHLGCNFRKGHRLEYKT